MTEEFFDLNIDKMLLLLGLDEDSIKIIEKVKNQKQDLNNDNHIDFDEFFEFCSKSIAIFNEIDLLEDAFSRSWINKVKKNEKKLTSFDSSFLWFSIPMGMVSCL